MPRLNSKARWAEQTLDEAVKTAKRIMRRVSLDDYAMRHGNHGAQLDNYYLAGFHAAIMLQSAVEIVSTVENDTRDGSTRDGKDDQSLL